MAAWLIIVLLVIVVGVIWYYVSGRASGSSGNVLPDGGVSGATEISLPSGVLASGTEQGTYGIQWWMLVSDWATKYGQEKPVLIRKTVTGHFNPQVVLHPTDNSLIVRVSYLPAEAKEGQPSSDATKKAVDGIIAQAKAANQPVPDWLTAAQNAIDYETFECTVSNIPLQSWFSVSLSLQQRSLDIYINGQLQKSCFIPGVPVGSAAVATVGEKGGFSGQVANMQFTTTPLAPVDALAFYNAGVNVKGGVNPSASGSWNPFKRYMLSFKVTDTSKGTDVTSGSI